MFDDKGVRKERTGWRDQWISQRHRTWGIDCPAVDVDFLLVEYAHKTPAALIEYKAVGAKFPDYRGASITALRILANNSHIPFFLVFYDRESVMFAVYSGNELAQQYERPNSNTPMDEAEYVNFLFRIRSK